MEDQSIIKPIIKAVDYFNSSSDEINYFYSIIDKFCAYWFGRQININKLSNVELILIHELLGEYLRFEENNKRVALWILAINRICYNFSRDLTPLFGELEKLNEDENLDIDSTLIEAILKQLKIFNDLHKNAGKGDDRGHEDIIANYLQWVMVYTGFIYPALNDKFSLHDKPVIKSMNFILMEFIKQRSNDKRMAYLVLGIIEACKQYSFQNESYYEEFIKSNSDKEVVLAGQDEALVKELLGKLRDENSKQSDNTVVLQDITPEQYIESIFNKILDEINNDVNLAVSNFNKYVLRLTSRFLSYHNEYQEKFLNELLNFPSKELQYINEDVILRLRKSMITLPEKTRIWLKNEFEKLNKNKGECIKNLINEVSMKEFVSKFNFVKPFMLLYLSYKFDII